MKSEENSFEIKVIEKSRNERIELKSIESNAFKSDVEKSGDKDTDVVDHKKSFPERIPAFGILMMILSAMSYSLGSLIIKLLPNIHSLEVLFFR